MATVTRRRGERGTRTEGYTAAEEADAPANAPDDEAPRARRRARTEQPDTTEDKPARSRRSGSEEPAAKRETDPDLVGSGWGGAAKVRSSGKFAERFAITEEQVVIHFLDNEPFATFKQHWINERKGQKSFTCIAKTGKNAQDCPLCDAGDKPSTQIGFNVVDFTSPGDPVLKAWWVGSRVSDQLKNFAEQEKTKPLNRDDVYFVVNRTGSQSAGYSTNINPVKERDLDEDWDVESLSDDELGEFEAKRYTRDIVEQPTVRELKEIARSLSDD